MKTTQHCDVLKSVLIFVECQIYTEASVVQWFSHSLCKPWVAGLILGFSNPLDRTLTRSRLHMTLAFGGTLNPYQPTNQTLVQESPIEFKLETEHNYIFVHHHGRSYEYSGEPLIFLHIHYHLFSLILGIYHRINSQKFVLKHDF